MINGATVGPPVVNSGNVTGAAAVIPSTVIWTNRVTASDAEAVSSNVRRMCNDRTAASLANALSLAVRDGPGWNTVPTAASAAGAESVAVL